VPQWRHVDVRTWAWKVTHSRHGQGTPLLVRKEEYSFLKKRTKKILFHKRTPLDRLSAISKSFLLLFFKKEVLSFLN
jgi:hypothetical protein